MEPEAFSRIGPIYDTVMAPVPYAAWANYVLLLARRHQAPSPGLVLDLACGTGNVGLELARRGYPVVGVDRSSGMLEQARHKARERGLQVEFYQQDMTALDLPLRFDWVVCLYDSLNYLLSEDDLGRAFAGVARHLNPCGVFFCDMNTEEALRKELFTQRETRRHAAVQYDWRSHYDEESGITRVEMTFWATGKDGTRQEIKEVHYERAYPLATVDRLLREAGLEPVACYDAYSLEQPRAATDRVFVVATRSEETDLWEP